MWRTNAGQTAVWEKLENGPSHWEMPSIYSSKYKNKLANNTGEWTTTVVCPHCHTPLSPYGGCNTCNGRWIRDMQRELEDE